MIKNISRGFDSFMQKYTPDPLIFAFILSALVFIAAYFLNNHSLLTLTRYWGDAFWSLNSFTLQMTMILFLGYVVASAMPVKNLLENLALIPKSLPAAAVCVTLLSLVGCYLNWGFGLIISALYCKELGKKFKGYGFATLVAFSYSGFLVWHGGLSGSIPLLVSTPGNFNEAQLGKIVPLTETIFSTLNLTIIALHFVMLPCLAYYLMRQNKHIKVELSPEDNIIKTPVLLQTPAEIIENKSLCNILFVLVSLSYIFSLIFTHKFIIDLDKVNFILFVLALALHQSPRAFINACQHASSKIWPLLIQYPLYAGIMAIMQKSGLGSFLSEIFLNFASAKTFPLLVFFSAGLLNIFIPSGGGQWAVQGPLVIDAAYALNANVNASMLAVAWGDAWTNMIQPFWALPLLAIAGLKAKDIMGTLVVVLLFSGILISSCFIIFV